MRINFFLAFLLIIMFGCGNDIDGEKDIQFSYKCISKQIATNISNRGASYLDSNKIIETSDYLFVIYLNNKFEVVVLKLEKNSFEVVSEKIIGKTTDNHGNPSITTDENGYIYIAYGGHQLNYTISKSSKPYDIDSWDIQEFSIKSNTGIVRDIAYINLL